MGWPETEVCRCGLSLTRTKSPTINWTLLCLVSAKCLIWAWAFSIFFLTSAKTASRSMSMSSTTSMLESPARYCIELKVFLPKVILYGEKLELECQDVLYDHSTQRSSFPHDEGSSGWSTMACRNWENSGSWANRVFNSSKKVKQGTNNSDSVPEGPSESLDRASATTLVLPERY